MSADLSHVLPDRAASAAYIEVGEAPDLEHPASDGNGTSQPWLEIQAQSKRPRSQSAADKLAD